MTNQHPITPPPELVERLCKNVIAFSTAMPPLTTKEVAVWLIEEAYVAGANQELEACCAEVLWQEGKALAAKLRAARRPKPPSLKEQALTAMLHLQKAAETNMDTIEAVHIICQALEALPND